MAREGLQAVAVGFVVLLVLAATVVLAQSSPPPGPTSGLYLDLDASGKITLRDLRLVPSTGSSAARGTFVATGEDDVGASLTVKSPAYNGAVYVDTNGNGARDSSDYLYLTTGTGRVMAGDLRLVTINSYVGATFVTVSDTDFDLNTVAIPNAHYAYYDTDGDGVVDTDERVMVRLGIQDVVTLNDVIVSGTQAFTRVTASTPGYNGALRTEGMPTVGAEKIRIAPSSTSSAAPTTTTTTTTPATTSSSPTPTTTAAADAVFTANEADRSVTASTVVGNLQWTDVELRGCRDASVLHAAATTSWASRTGPVGVGDRITGCTPGETVVLTLRRTGGVFLQHRFAGATTTRIFAPPTTTACTSLDEPILLHFGADDQARAGDVLLAGITSNERWTRIPEGDARIATKLLPVPGTLAFADLDDDGFLTADDLLLARIERTPMVLVLSSSLEAPTARPGDVLQASHFAPHKVVGVTSDAAASAPTPDAVMMVDDNKNAIHDVGEPLKVGSLETLRNNAPSAVSLWSEPFRAMFVDEDGGLHVREGGCSTAKLPAPSLPIMLTAFATLGLVLRRRSR